MTVEQRIKVCLLIEKIHQQKDYSLRLGLEECSKFHGEWIQKEDEKKC